MTTADLNQVLISGHVRRQPELREKPDGHSVCRSALNAQSLGRRSETAAASLSIRFAQR
jgi:single-stranded DNA-binding protein